MIIQYGKIIKYYKDNDRGSQLFDVEMLRSDRVYHECEILSQNFTSIPSIGDIVVVAFIGNSETIILGKLYQHDLDLKEDETKIYTAKNGVLQSEIFLDSNGEIFVEVKPNGTTKSKISFLNTGEIKVETEENINIISQKGINITSTDDLNITAPTVNVI